MARPAFRALSHHHFRARPTTVSGWLRRAVAWPFETMIGLIILALGFGLLVGTIIIMASCLLVILSAGLVICSIGVLMGVMVCLSLPVLLLSGRLRWHDLFGRHTPDAIYDPVYSQRIDKRQSMLADYQHACEAADEAHTTQIHALQARHKIQLRELDRNDRNESGAAE